MPTRPDAELQCGIIPFRRSNEGLEVLLVTSARRRRWIIPKGNVAARLSPLESARQEAYEEAGVRGRIRAVPFGTYQHAAWSKRTNVQVYLMEVETELPNWPERTKRERRWMRPREAYDRVLESGLKQLLRELEEIYT